MLYSGPDNFRKKCKKKMGKSESKSKVEHNGDPQVRVINKLLLHSEPFENHELLLCLILGVVTNQLALNMYQLFKKYTNQKAFEKEVFNDSLK